jgi:hypothetical protein
MGAVFYRKMVVVRSEDRAASLYGGEHALSREYTW